MRCRGRVIYSLPMQRAELIDRIRRAALLRGEFTLRSGRTSKYYLDKYLFETQPDILETLGKMFAGHIDASIDRLAGAELGGIPLVAVTSIISGLPCVLIRNRKKSYGTAKQLEGRLNPGDCVMIVEDIATSGGQVLEAARTISDQGGQVAKIVAAVDREEGARQNIEGAGYRFESLLTKSDLGISE